jgi:hypothetical protein
MPVTVEVEHASGAFEKERVDANAAGFLRRRLVLSSLPAFVPLEAG